jgi:hypothetical protein
MFFSYLYKSHNFTFTWIWILQLWISACEYYYDFFLLLPPLIFLEHVSAQFSPNLGRKEQFDAPEEQNFR